MTCWARWAADSAEVLKHDDEFLARHFTRGPVPVDTSWSQPGDPVADLQRARDLRDRARVRICVHPDDEDRVRAAVARTAAPGLIDVVVVPYLEPGSMLALGSPPLKETP